MIPEPAESSLEEYCVHSAGEGMVQPRFRKKAASGIQSQNRRYFG